ncbi:MAG: hypothetical protein KC477_01575 [Oceanospirillaceae bacterium]|nr:hypothetical protein [Oceanospirillaceae bacterium]
MNTLNPKQSQLLAVGILLLAVLLVVLFFIQPLFARYQASSEEIEQLEQRLAVYKRVASGLQSSEEQLETLRKNNPIADLYLAESKPTLAAAELQKKLSQMVTLSGGQVVSTQILQKNTDSVLPTVALQIHIRSEIDELADLLYTIESGKPLLFIDNLVITSAVRRVVQRSSRTRRQPQVRRTLPSLDIRFDLVGHSGKGE